MAGPQIGLAGNPYAPARRHPVASADARPQWGNDLSEAAFCSLVVAIVVGPLYR
jgi:hypothetical protein